MNKETGKVGLRNIAQHAGVSLWTVSHALRNEPGVSAATRKRILRIAKKMGYAPDARIVNWMSRVREARSKDLLPIAWLNTTWEKDAWRRYLFHAPYLEGASERALELGYKLEDIWYHEHGMTMKRLAKILYERGIEGVIVTYPARHMRLDWDHLASVAIGEALLAPKLHRVATDINFNLQLALKSLRRLGYRRIGICLPQHGDSSSHSSIRATARDFYFSASATDRVPPLFHPLYWRKGVDKKKNEEIAAWLRRYRPSAIVGNNVSLAQWAEWTGFGHMDNEREMVAWLKRYKPEVIVGHNNRLVDWTEGAGFRVPKDVGIVHLAVDNDVLDWAGIYSRRHQTGAAAVDSVVSLMQHHQFGVPKTPLNILIRGTWQNGITLISN